MIFTDLNIRDKERINFLCDRYSISDTILKLLCRTLLDLNFKNKVKEYHISGYYCPYKSMGILQLNFVSSLGEQTTYNFISKDMVFVVKRQDITNKNMFNTESFFKHIPDLV